MKKIFAVSGFMLLVLSLLLLLVLPNSQVMAEWDCEYITVTHGTYQDGDTEMVTATINFPNTPETIQNVPIAIEYDTQELTYTDYTQSGCFPEIYNNIFSGVNDETPGQLVLSWWFIDAIPAGSEGCLIKLIFENLVSPVVPEICISDLGGDIQDWCDNLPMCCRIEITPHKKTIYPGDTIQFSADSFYCLEVSSYSWSVESSIESVIDGNGFYTAGNNYTGDPVIDDVTATDTINGVSGTAVVTVESIPPPTSTTTTSVLIECTSNADCDDGLFCNGAELCKLTWSSSLAGGTGDEGLGRRCVPGGNPCSDDGIFCNGEESCDEGKDICLHSGNPCAGNSTDKLCDEEDDACVGCFEDSDCDDGLYCNGEDTCEDGVCIHVGDPCTDDGEFCNGDEICDEEIDECVSEGDPCIGTENPVCDEEEDICGPVVPPPSVQVAPDPVYQSRWIPLPVLLNITAKDDAKFDVTSSVIFNPNAIWALPLVISEEEIIAMGLIMPQWLTGPIASEKEGDINVTVITGSQEAPGTIEVQLLPFFLDEDKAILE